MAAEILDDVVGEEWAASGGAAAPCAEKDAHACYAALLVQRRLEAERVRREAARLPRPGARAWLEATLLPVFDGVAASLRAAGVPAGAERVDPWIVRLRIGDNRRGDVERWIEVNVFPHAPAVTARVDRLARHFPGCDTFPSGEPPEDAPSPAAVRAWLETLVAQVFA